MNNSSNTQITAIIVLYKTTLTDCLTYKTLKENITSCEIDFDLILYNNSPEICIPISTDYQVINSKENGMLCGAYNFALDYSIVKDIKWLLLLDQDTEISSEYLKEMNLFLKNDLDENCVAIAPILKEGSKILSPKKFSSFGWWLHDIKKTGYQHGRITAFNSLTLISVDFMKSLGGFSERYPLDMLDHWYYNQIFLRNKKVYILNSKIPHSLSLLNYENEINLKRHNDFLDAELKLVREEFKFSHYFTYKIRLSIRFFKQMLLFKNKKYHKITFMKLLKFK